MRISSRIASVVWLLCLCGSSTEGGKFEVKFVWKQLIYNWPSQAVEELAIKTGQYIPKHNLPLGLDRWQDKIFITVPRFNDGIAATLSYIDLNSKEEPPKLQPYPSWEDNFLPLNGLRQHPVVHPVPQKRYSTSKPNRDFKLRSNSTLVSALRVQVDACDRLWVIDSGLLDIPNRKRQLVPNAVVIFDLKTNKLLRRFNIPQAQIRDDTSLVNIVVESDASDCDGAYAYLPDLGTYSMIVYSYRENRSFRFKHNYFHSDPLQGDFNVDGVRFQWDGGVFGMAVGATKPDATKDIYFHSLASYKEYKVSNRVLQNETYVSRSAAYDEFKYLGERGNNTQSTTEVYDAETNVLFYTLVNKDAIGCWNVQQPFNADTQGIVEHNADTLPYPNDVKLDTEGNVWVLSNRLPTVQYKQVDPEANNYIIAVGNNRELIKGTPCDV